MTLLNTSGVLVILTVILLLWFVPRSLRRAPAGPAMEPERPLISAERTAEDILASAGVLLNESEAYQSSDHAVAPGTSLPSSALPQASSRSSHTVEESAQPAPDTASISQIRESSPTAPYTDEIPVVEDAKPSPLSYFDTSSPSGIALLVAAGLGVLALVTGLLALFGVLAWGWAVLFLILAGGTWAVSRFGLLESLATQVKANRDERRAKAEAEEAEGNDAEGEAYEESSDDEAFDGATEPAEGPIAEGVESEAAEEPEPQTRPATREAVARETAARKPAGNVNREAARPSRAHIAVESSAEAPEVTAHTEAPARAVRPVSVRSAATRSTEPPAAHRQERRQQRPSRFQPIRRGSVLFDQESGSATSSGAPRTAAQPQRVAQAPVAPSQPVQPQPAQAPVQAPAKPVAAQPAPATQAPAQPVVAPAQQPAIHPDQPVARQALRDGSPVRQAPAAPATQAPAQPIPEEIPLPDVLDDSEFDALDIASLNDPALSTGAPATGGVRSTNRHPGAGSSFEAVSNTWNPVQLPKPLSALHRQDKNQGKK
ncbi:MAG: hypothetical protein HXO64_02975 [Rothia mucilaginosa]|uniref:Uncharacterized protein n=1 Tax=Rothia mucilaginosa TaxID=43675 RepID=A0A930PUD3_9MICC|nr:hypothetical protein [Rothia mucilaginosa]MBF1663500.1 hypothetical protein [Rothia mucilaginosa]